jgi:glycosyltransferase involved in cell wall biosynthesis
MTRTSEAPLVSVVIPVRDARRYVGEAIASVLGQRERALEVIVVDDGSGDDSVAVVEAVADPRVRLLTQPPAGAAAARNRGVGASSAPYLAFLDADDRWTPAKLALQLAALNRHASAEMVLGHAREIDENGMRLRTGAPRPAYSPCSMLVRRAAFERVGDFETGPDVGEFIDWFARAEDAGLAHLMLPDVVMERRVHAANMTRTEEARAGYARVVRNVAARRGRARHASR